MYDLICVDRTKTYMKFHSYMLLKDFQIIYVIVIIFKG